MREERPKHLGLLGVGVIDDFGHVRLQVPQRLDRRLLFARLSEPNMSGRELGPPLIENASARTVVSE